MASLLITNLTTSDIPITELYAILRASSTITTNRPVSALPGMKVLQEQIAAGNVTLAVTLTAAEAASGLASPPDVIGADDFAEVADTAVAAPMQAFRKTFAATGATGTKVDATIFAANALPYAFRVMDVLVLLSTTTGGTTAELCDEVAGGGTVIASMATAATGPNRPSSAFEASSVVSQSTAAKGLFLNYDRASVGEVIVTVRRETV